MFLFFLDQSLIDFGVCFFNELYRSDLIAHNRCNLSLRFQIETPPLLDKFLEFTPKIGFIQPFSPLHIAVKLRVNESFLKNFPQFENPTVEFPLTMRAANQVLPVEFLVKFTPSPTKILVDPQFLDFGTLLNSESKEVSAKITSQLVVPINFGFVKLPPSLTVYPFDGFGLILPGETLEIVFRFHSTLIKKHEFELTLATLQGSKLKLHGQATVTTSPISLSSTNIKFESTVLGESSNHSLTVHNLPCTLR